jgi:hypothetical protein
VRLLLVFLLLVFTLSSLVSSELDVIVASDQVKINVSFPSIPAVGFHIIDIYDNENNKLFSYPTNIIARRLGTDAGFETHSIEPKTSSKNYFNFDDGEYLVNVSVKRVDTGLYSTSSKYFTVDRLRDCGNGIIQGYERCDSDNLSQQTCDIRGYDGGELFCTDDCEFDETSCYQKGVCGDGNLSAGEVCDVNSDSWKNGFSCEEYDPTRYSGGKAYCINDCGEIDLSSCEREVNFCGDGEIQEGEQCDGSVPGGLSCSDLGFTTGSLRCNDCRLNTSFCTGPTGGYCGDDIVSLGEQCEEDSHNLTCKDFDFDDGKLECTNCMINTNDCENNDPSYCGNDKIDFDSDELCDGEDFNGKTCSSLPDSDFSGGTLFCSDNCRIRTDGCTSDGVTITHCSNNKTDGDESDVDCGGKSCLFCSEGKKCSADSDCLSKYCYNNICTEPSCTDNIKNGDESDVDCGGFCEDKCDLEKSCFVDGDCESNFCLEGSCTEASCDDGYANGGESDVDCGSVCDVLCENSQNCRFSSDCKSSYCSPEGICDVDRTKDSDGDGMEDYWELRYGLDPNDSSDANKDLDKDGYTNYEERQNGTDPTVSDREKGSVLGLTIFIIGLLVFLGSIGFLVYYRIYVLPSVKTVQAPVQNSTVQNYQRTKPVQKTTKKSYNPEEKADSEGFVPIGAFKKSEDKKDLGDKFNKLKNLNKDSEDKQEAFEKLKKLKKDKK